MSNGRQGIRKTYSIILEISAIIVWVLSFFGILAYVIHYIQYIASLNPSKIQSLPTPIDLAAVTAVIGGLILIGAFYKDKGDVPKQEKQKAKHLKTIAKLLLCSSVFFIISFFTLEYVRLITSPTLSLAEWFFVISTDVAISVAGVTLTFALGYLVRVIPRL